MPIPKAPSNAGHFGQGIAYPLTANNSGRLVLSFGAAAAEDAMESIMQTEPGERVMQPDYGGAVGVHEPVGDPFLMAEAIKQTVRDHEARVESDSIEVENKSPDSHGKVETNVTYRPVGEITSATLTYPYFKVINDG